MVNKEYKQLQELSVFVHGILTGLHLLGVAYNLKRKNWKEAVAHVGATAFSTWAVNKHLNQLRDCEPASQSTGRGLHG